MLIRELKNKTKFLSAKKRFGQHFLINIEIAQKIVEASKEESKNLLEIGPGKGILTKLILKDTTLNYKLIEIDTDCCNYLKSNIPKISNQLINKDFLNLNIESLFNNSSFSIIGNFPYNISTQIIFKILDTPEKIITTVGMFQKEVAQRICASHGSKIYGVTSVLTQFFYDTEYLFTVSAEEFDPPPKVLSAVIKLTQKKNLPSKEEYRRLKVIVKTAFNQRRKTLKNSLKTLLLKDLIFSPYKTMRPEQISLKDFIILSKSLIEN